MCLKIFFAEVFTDITYANYASQENNHGSFTKNILCQKCCTLNSLMQDSGGGMNKKFSGGQKQNAKMPRMKPHSHTRIKEIFNNILPQVIYCLSLLTS